jgi:hypothetical protein
MSEDAMMSVRVCFLLLVSTMALAQSQCRPTPPVNQPLATRLTNGVSQAHTATQGKIFESYGRLPLGFEANHGQTDAQAKFLSRGSGYMLFLTSDEAVFTLRRGESKGDTTPAVGDQLHPKALLPTTEAVLRMRLVKANRAAKVTGTDELPGKSNYFIGNDLKKWRSNVPTYAKVKYEGIYSGIDLVYYGNQRQLEFDFVVAPGADPRRIQFNIRGAKKIRLDKDGGLVLQMADGELRWHKPVAYQEKDGKRHEIDGRYVIERGQQVSFKLGGYDSKRLLVIDPALGYSTYLGGSGGDYGYGIAVDSSGNAYVTGTTASTNFPTMNPLQPVNEGATGNAFITELNPTGSALVYSTYLGGSGGDYGYGIAVDSSGNAYVTGLTGSTNFPLVNPLQPDYGGGTNDAFVAKINSSGSALVYSTYLGGCGSDAGSSITVDGSGNAYVTGITYTFTESVNFPTTPGAFQTVCGGGPDTYTCWDAFVSKLNPAGSALVYSTYLGGSLQDQGSGIAVDSSGNAYVTGLTTSINFPTMNPLQPVNGGGANGNGTAFITELNPTGSALVYSTYLGGSGGDAGSSIAVDGSGNAYVTGLTASTNFPTMNPLQPANGGTYDAFVSKLNPAGSALVYSTYLGGNGSDFGRGIAVDGSGNAYVTGTTASTNFPTMNPLQPACGDGDSCTSGDAFVTKINSSGSALAYSTYLGGSGADEGWGIAVDSSGNAYVTGNTASTNFPTMNPLQPANGGTYDAFVAKFVPAPFVTLSPTSLNFGNQNVGTISAPQNVTLTNSGDAALNISGIVTTGDFVQTNTCPVGGSLAAESSCGIAVTFSPSAAGTRNGGVTITDSASNSPQSVPLTGVGLQPAVTLSPTGLNFGNQTVDITSTPQVSTLTNTGNGTLTITSINVTGTNKVNFAETNNCGTSVPAGGSCNISVTFTPYAPANRTAAVSISDNAPNSPQSISLTGVGVLPAVTFSQKSLTFPTQVVFTNSKAKTVTLSNTGLGILKIASIAATGPFAQTNTCGTTVNPSASCTISVTFSPTTIGTLTGSVSVTDNAPKSPQQVTLTGTGTSVQLTPVSVNFGNQPVGTTSLAKRITLINEGSVTVNITGISLTGTNASDFAQTNTCGTSVASGASCFIKVTFTPSATGKRTAQVLVSDDGGGSPQKTGLTGNGTP